ncbi:MAG: hypothetical protein AAGF07_05160 [Patescibacteria group bacterium]
MLERIRYWLSSSSTDKKKVIFWIVIALVIFLVVVIAAFNTFSDQSSQVPDIDNNRFEPEVTLSNFESATNLEQVSNAEVGLARQVFFIPGGKIGFFNRNFKLNIDNQEVALSPSFFPNQVYSSPSGIIINSDTFSTFYLNTGEFQNFTSDIQQITPYQIPDDLGIDTIPGYLFLRKDQNTYTVQQSTSNDLEQSLKTVATFNLPKGFTDVELKIISNQIYIVMYGYSNEGTNIRLAKLDGASIQQVQSLSSVQSIIFGPDKVLYTIPSDNLPELTNYESAVIDFSKNSEGDISRLNVTTTLVQNNILGSLLARRCNFDNFNNLFCLVKQQKTNSDNFRFKDSLVKIDLTKNQLSYPAAGLVFSASNILVSNNGTLYIVGQENNILYRVKT